MFNASYLLVATILALNGQVSSQRTPSKSSLTIGMVYIAPEGTQYLDTGSIDLLYMMTPEYQTLIGAPEIFLSKAVQLDIHHIAENASTPVSLTGDVTLNPTDSFSTAPTLDVLLIPGPTPHHRFTEAELDFVRSVSLAPSTTAVLGICTGISPFSASGVLSGQNATGTLLLLPMLKAKYPDVRWQTRRWVGEGTKFWTSGGITYGMDATAAWMREYFWDRAEFVEFVLMLASVGERGVEYDEAELKYWEGIDMSGHDEMHADMGGMGGDDMGEMGGDNKGEMGGHNMGEMGGHDVGEMSGHDMGSMGR